ncbi:MAG: polymerase III, epsilon subunit protein [Candidatus Peregrinibacteria bacterium GW2011_GWF2_38_29]|nr:MAG: polymerase III, epsilon subunit protein [Candidatus Peregrinibacteria bacterium GW2011_GWF2_38_29]HBB03115.1 hypothetical protein [Candidatus Peregrinibacteria bacterium]
MANASSKYSEKILLALQNKEKIIFENAPNIDIEECSTDAANQFSENTIIALSSPLAPSIKEKTQYLSPARFEKFLEKELTNEETIFAIKIITGLEKSKLGEKSDFALFRGENTLWTSVCCDEFECNHDKKSECFYLKALKNLEESKAITISHLTLLKEIKTGSMSLPKAKNLILGNFENIYETAEFALSEIYYSSDLENLAFNETLKIKLEMLFGMLWLMIEKATDQTNQNAYLSVELSEAYKGSKEWNQISAIALFAKEILDKEKPTELVKKLQILMSVLLSENSNYKTKIERSENEKVKIVLIPLNAKEIVKKNIFEKYESIILISSNLSVNKSLAYIKEKNNIQGFKEDFILSDEKPETAFYFIEDFKNLNRESLHRSTAELAKYLIKRTGGKTLCVFLSKISLKATFNDTYADLKKHEIEIYAQDVSGGRGKVIDSYISNSDHSALFILEHFFNFIDLNEIEFDQILFSKFYFGNNDEETILRIKRIFNKLLAKGVKRVFIADPQALKAIDEISASMTCPVEMKSIKVGQIGN